MLWSRFRKIQLEFRFEQKGSLPDRLICSITFRVRNRLRNNKRKNPYLFTGKNGTRTRVCIDASYTAHGVLDDLACQHIEQTVRAVRRRRVHDTRRAVERNREQDFPPRVTRYRYGPGVGGGVGVPAFDRRAQGAVGRVQPAGKRAPCVHADSEPGHHLSRFRPVRSRDAYRRALVPVRSRVPFAGARPAVRGFALAPIVPFTSVLSCPYKRNTPSVPGPRRLDGRARKDLRESDECDNRYTTRLLK